MQQTIQDVVPVQVYMVVGGYSSSGYVDSTETLVEGDSAWTDHPGALPSTLGLAGLLTLDNIPYVTGGKVRPV